jgi:hypothetical protein
VTEREFTTALLDLARILHWRSAHFRPARTAHGWATPVQGDGRGWPDVLLVRPPRIVVAELKVGGGRVSDDQRVWLEQLEQCPGVEVFTWRPKDLDVIARVLR